MEKEMQRILYELRKLFQKMIDEGFDLNEQEIERKFLEIRRELGHWFVENPMIFKAS